MTDVPERALEQNAPLLTPRRWVVAWLVGLLSVTIAVRVLDATPWLGSDDTSYHSAAEFVLAGKTIERAHHHYARLSVILAVAASMAVLGNNVTAVVFPTIVLSVACVMLVVFIGRLMYDWWVGLCAGSVVAVLPYYRVLSTTAYPDVHACFWATLSATMILLAMRADARTWRFLFAGCAGFSLGLAASAKIFAACSAIGFVALAWSAKRRSARCRLGILLAAAGGGSFFCLMHGLAYQIIADDFWFKWHVLTSAQGQAHLFLDSGNPLFVGPLHFFRNRMLLLFHPTTSGWGWLALAFWPASIYVLIADRRGRPLAIWAITSYLLLAFSPVSLKFGYRPYPIFDGRHMLFVCVPFALCLAATAHRLLRALTCARTVQNAWPAVLAAIVAIAYANPLELPVFRYRPTSRIGTAITRLIHTGALDASSAIYMTPSMYWRYRVLFPTELRNRLRVSTDDSAPPWWRHTTTDIEERLVSGPPPVDSMLLATPKQLTGQAEFWDYNVTLSRPTMQTWHTAATVATIDKYGVIVSAADAKTTQTTKPLLLLKQVRTATTNRNRKKNYHSNVG